jgi:hypothetical protein
MSMNTNSGADSAAAFDESAGSNSRRHAHARGGKSGWDFFQSILCLIAAAGIWIGFAHLLLAYRRAQYPPDAFLSNGTRLGNILMYVTPFFPALCLAFLTCNSLVWLFSLTRSTDDPEERTRANARFRSSLFTLAKLGAIVCAVALPLCLPGANNFWALAPGRIDYRPMFAATVRHYSWSDVEKISTGCTAGKSRTYNFVLTLSDGTRLDLMEESPWEFSIAYPEVQSALTGHPYQFSSAGLVGRCVAQAPRRWLEILAKKPTE